ncbi:MAG: hypothetical protein ACF8SC_09885 [Phycisphaerales bacterium JB037]
MLPPGEDNDRWKDAIGSIIGLHAVTHALLDLDRVGNADRPAALDRAALLIREHAGSIHRVWAAQPMPESLIELEADARAALEHARHAGVQWRVADDPIQTDHPDPLVEELQSLGFAGDLYLPTPGVPMFAGAPAGFCAGPHGTTPDQPVLALVGAFLSERDGLVGTPERVAPMRQVYRQFDFAAGGPVRDVVRPMDADLPAGQPLLVPAILAGVPQPIALLPRAVRLDHELPVIEET